MWIKLKITQMKNSAITSNNKRNDGIDLLRGFCILSVILLHCFIHMPFEAAIPKNVLNIIFRSGYYGVMIFFVISGFLITSLSLRRWGALGDICYRAFYQMRIARIMPCLLILVLILCLLDIGGVTHFVIHTVSLTQAVFSVLTFQVNWLEAQTGYLPANWDVLWSLAVEEMFYLFFPLLCLLLRKKTHFIYIMLVFVVAGPVARTTIVNEMWSDHSYLSCMDGIAIGVLSALYASQLKPTPVFMRNCFLIGLSLFSFIFLFRKEVYDLGISRLGLNVTFLELSIGLILIFMQQWYEVERKPLNVLFAPLRWLGRSSYETYLTHIFIIMILASTIFIKGQSLFIVLCLYALTILLSGLCGWLMRKYFSEPANNLLRKKLRAKVNAEYSYSRTTIS